MADLFSGASAQNPASFNFGNRVVRVIQRDSEPWFVAADVCGALDYKNTTQAVADNLDPDERSIFQIERGGSLVLINESGLYALVLRSRKPEARKFAKWVTGEVLPSIRKTGGYGADFKPSLKTRRWLISFDHNGNEVIKEIDWDDCLLKQEDIPMLIRAPGNMIETELLTSIAQACVDRLSDRATKLAQVNKALRGRQVAV